jgi:potassium-dependent mechanosensitive channel
MRNLSQTIPRLIVMLSLGLTSGVVPADTTQRVASTSPITLLSERSQVVAVADLKDVEHEQDRIKQLASTTTSARQLAELDTTAQRLANSVDRLLTASLLPAQVKLRAQLDVLGTAPTQGPDIETPAVAAQRKDLDSQQKQLDTQVKEAQSTKKNLANLIEQITKLQHNQLKNQLALRSGSVLGVQFWAPLIKPEAADQQRLNAFAEQVFLQIKSAWQPGHQLITSLLLVLALAIWAPGGRMFEWALASFGLHRIPVGLQRSSTAVATTLTSVLTTACAIQIVHLAITRQQPFTPELQDFADELIRLALACALIAGLGRALLSTRRPSWRLPAIADPVAVAMKPFPRILAGLLMLSGALEQLNRTVDTSLQVTLFGRGLVSLVVVLTIGAQLVRANRVRTALAASGHPPEARSTLAGLIHAAVSLTVGASLLALLIGYISIARFLTYELVWFDMVLCSFYLLTRLTRDLCESMFSAHHSSGKNIKHLLGLDDAHLVQISTVLSGIGNSLLLLLTVIALLTGDFGTTPTDLLNSVLDIFGGDRLRSLNIVPAHILNALITLGVGFYLLRSVQRWLNNELLPKIGMDPGMRASLATLFSNIGYVIIVLLTLSALGVRWDNLAWIVSALSVGIGFGLQEIVKNFVSGVILLTERPVKVGDLISISGVEGDIRRINVRATEIRLADRSTVIVPNSQLISQNLRNITMGNSAQGVATLVLTFPLNTDLEQVRDLLLDAYREHLTILDKPSPAVKFSQLAPDGITLSVTGYVSSPRIASNTKSDLLFEVLKRLRAANISLSNPQTLMVQSLPAPEPG